MPCEEATMRDGVLKQVLQWAFVRRICEFLYRCNYCDKIPKYVLLVRAFGQPAEEENLSPARPILM